MSYSKTYAPPGARAGRPASGMKKPNMDIINFVKQGSQLNERSRPADTGINRQDSYFSRASGGVSGRAVDSTRKGATLAGGFEPDFDAYDGGRDRDYGARKRMPMSAADKKDKIINIERENYTLKEKENFLQ